MVCYSDYVALETLDELKDQQQYCDWENAATNGTWSVTRNAPFGTSYTPDTARLKIINGKMVSVDDNGEQPLVSSSPLRTESETPPVAQLVSRFPPIDSQSLPTGESQHFNGAVTRHPHFGETRSRESLNEFISEDDDGNLSRVGQPRNTSQRHVLPPINPNNGRSHNLFFSANNGTEVLKESVFRQTTSSSDRPATLTRSEELEILSKRVREELINISTNQLKYIYLKLAEVDTNMTGYISFREVEHIFRECKIDLSPMTLRLIASMFLSVHRSNLVDYKELVSFIAKSIQTYSDSEDRDLASTGALRRVVEKQLMTGGCCLEFEQIWNFFQRADRSRRDRLSKDQIKRLVTACHVPLSEYVVDQVLNRCSSTSDRYSWQDFLGYIEHVYPMKTSLTIPPTQRRVKEIPVVSSNWPELETTPRVRISELPLDEELSNLGTVVQETKKRLNEERRDGSYVLKPWFERFMHMAKALYGYDQSNSGFIDASITRWIIQEYNKSYNLGLDKTKVDLAMIPFTEDNHKVAIEPFLKTLVAQGP